MKLRHVLTLAALTFAFACAPPGLAASAANGSASNSGQSSSQTAKTTTDDAVLNQGKYRDYSQAQIKELQQALTAKGFNVTATGLWDRATRDAIQRFQEKNHLNVTGNPNAETRQALGLDW